MTQLESAKRGADRAGSGFHHRPLRPNIIAAAIGGAIAAAAGADFLCYVTPAEHLGLPTQNFWGKAGIIVKRWLLIKWMYNVNAIK